MRMTVAGERYWRRPAPLSEGRPVALIETERWIDIASRFAGHRFSQDDSRPPGLNFADRRDHNRGLRRPGWSSPPEHRADRCHQNHRQKPVIAPLPGAGDHGRTPDADFDGITAV